MDLKDTTRCANCYREFADHNYLLDSMDKYQCPTPQHETGYGYFPGGDPRDFHPDHECCTPEEIAAHREACEAWDKGDKPETPPGSRYLYDDEGKVVAHVCGGKFGIGIYQLEIESWFEPLDEDCGVAFDEE